ncbi:NAD-dependent epimerase/dehydratase family protein [Thiohalorhabdus sp.]|uniref:NAD-dependent epimerase/dehydratase family protein n=1 Tax=Thiohalorhabdus sp. TaxID=3094134 RepID=UPI002FC28DA5
MPPTPLARPVVAIAGCGYVGMRLAHWLAAGGYAVLAGSRDPGALRHRLPRNALAFRLDLDSGAGVAALAAADRVVAAYPPPRGGTNDPRSARLVAAMADRGKPQQAVYLSTTGVYGDRGGKAVSEIDAPAPRSERAQRRLDAEARWRRLGREGRFRVSVLRVAGIYGPGRLPAEAVKAGTAPRVAWPETRYTNTIHVDDLVALIGRVLDNGRPNRVYHGCDGQQRRQGALIEAVARALGTSLPPPLDPAAAERELSPMRLSFLAESRCCCNQRARRELGWSPRFTDLDAGVAASLAEQRGEG